MKALLFSLLLITTALLLIGASEGYAQPKDADRDWVDSLAVRYRSDFIKNAMLRDQARLDSMSASVYVLIFNLQDHQGLARESIHAIVRAVRHYDFLRQAVKIRRTAYRKEILSARINFNAL